MSRRRGLTTEKHLAIRIDATLSRDAFTNDPGAVVAAALELAGDRRDILAESAGLWVGSHEHLQECAPLVKALRPYADSDAAAASRHRRRTPHGGDVGPR